MKLVFYGTPDFAVASLEAIIGSSHKVLAVVTAPDKPAGRGMHLKPSPVKECAVKHGIPVLQPVKLKDPEFLANLKNLNPDIQVVIAFRMLPEQVWNFPKLGTINLHASLLPDYRGAAPINRAIMNGETQTGVCTFFLKHEIDTGNIIDSETCAIGPDTNAGELHDQLMHIGASLIVRTLDKIASGNYTPIPQAPSGIPKTAPKIFTLDCDINWALPGEMIRNLIRGLSPYPAAFTLFDEKKLRIFSAEFVPEEMRDTEPGTFRIDQQKELLFACKNGWIKALDVQLEGKKRMLVKEFLNGYRPKNGS